MVIGNQEKLQSGTRAASVALRTFKPGILGERGFLVLRVSYKEQDF